GADGGGSNEAVGFDHDLQTGEANKRGFYSGVPGANVSSCTS
ncbi:MAG: hypothetical protein H6R08_1212, partial [Proteobacteria bacterium]|nr:hypothetical protein [Pseudomonadota bacterium]